MRIAAFLLALAFGFGISRFAPNAQAVNPPSPYQVNPDIYACCGLPSVFAGTTPGDLQSLNPISQKLRAGSRNVTYSYVVVAGCADGNMRTTLAESLADAQAVLHLTFTPVSFGGDLTIRATCGVDASNVGLSGGAICDLYPSWPYKSQVNCSTTMATFYNLSQKTIWSHEIVGHSLGTWSEGYMLGGTFAPTPGLVDFMNTGELSRQTAWPQNDKDRWERTMYLLSAAADCATIGYDPCTGRFFQPDGFSYEPSSGQWFNPQGSVEFYPCNSDGIRWDPPLGVFMPPGSGAFQPSRGFWAFAPPC